MQPWLSDDSCISQEVYMIISFSFSNHGAGHRELRQTNVFHSLCIRWCTQINFIWMGRPLTLLNTLKLKQNGCHFMKDSFKCNFLNENASILIKFSLKFVPKGPINNITSLVKIMAWHRPGEKPSSEPMMVSLLTHICVIQFSMS